MGRVDADAGVPDEVRFAAPRGDGDEGCAVGVELRLQNFLLLEAGSMVVGGTTGDIGADPQVTPVKGLPSRTL